MNTQSVKQLLKENNLRKTSFRKTILKIIANSHEPLSADMLKKKMNHRTKTPHLSTIYRELSTLTTYDILEECEILGKKEYGLKNKCAIIHCVKCNTATPLSEKEVSEIKKANKTLEKRINFSLNNQEGHIHGTCAECK